MSDAVQAVHDDSATSSQVAPVNGALHLAVRLKATLGSNDRLIVFAGVGEEDGSSAVASETAGALAQMGVGPVLLLDGNLRAPRVADLHSIPDTPGLLELLRERAHFEQVIYPSQVENLTLLPSADTDREIESLLTGAAMARLVDELRRRYRFTIFDAAPVRDSADASLLGSIADGVVIVAARGRQRRSQLLEAKRVLDAVEAKVLGVVLSEESAR